MDRRKFLSGSAGVAATLSLPLSVLAWVKSKRLTLDEITREALRIVHEKLSFIGERKAQWPTNKTGDTLRIRRPVSYGNLTFSVDDFASKYIEPAIDELRKNGDAAQR